MSFDSAVPLPEANFPTSTRPAQFPGSLRGERFAGHHHLQAVVLGGLWLPVTITPLPVPSSWVAKYTIGVATTPMSVTSMPAALRPRARAATRRGPDRRPSRPTTKPLHAPGGAHRAQARADALGGLLREGLVDDAADVVGLEDLGCDGVAMGGSFLVIEEVQQAFGKPADVARERTGDEADVAAGIREFYRDRGRDLVRPGQGGLGKEGVVAGIEDERRHGDVAQHGLRARARPVVVGIRKPCRGAVTTSSNSRRVRARRMRPRSKLAGKRACLAAARAFIVTRKCLA